MALRAKSLLVTPILLALLAPHAIAQSAGVLSISPESGTFGTSLSVSGNGVAGGARVDIQWTTWDGRYSMEITPTTVAYHQRTFTEKRVSLGQVTADASGHFDGMFTAPEDFGQLHEIHSVVDGQDQARGGFQEQMDGTATPRSGPIGTPIHIHITGLDTDLFSGSTLAVRYDNAYTGLLTAATTHGTADAVIRASGATGAHSIFVGPGTLPAYLNIHQSPYDFLYAHLPGGEGFSFTFNTTRDPGPPPPSIEWPSPDAVQSLPADAPRTTLEELAPSTASLSLDRISGPILTTTHLSATGLTPGDPIAVFFVTARGNRVSDTGWDLQPVQLGAGQPDSKGNLDMDVQVPDDLGGWHELRLVQDELSVAQAPFYVERSLVSVSPEQAKVGDTVTIHAKGLGWTELDNGFAVTYDNMFVGYACGFNSNGDVAVPLVATGGPGTHLIDLYPMVYNGQDKKAWYWAPVLTFAQDFPALSLGYRLPAFHLAISTV